MAEHVCEVWVLVDQDGDYVAARDQESARNTYDDEVGGDLSGSRWVKLTARVPMPEPVELTGAAPAVPVEGGQLFVAGDE